MEAKLSSFKYPEGALTALAFDMSEFDGACRGYLERVRKLLANAEQDPNLVGVKLTTIEAGLEDARGHLEDLRESLPRLYSFLARLGDEDLDVRKR
ncbi:MAG: hypothetical protein ACT4P5_02130 [Armatimonadota bacterium]